MDFVISYYSEAVQEAILGLPDGLAARYVVLTRRIVMLRGFIKKSERTPRRELLIARKRIKEVKHAHS